MSYRSALASPTTQNGDVGKVISVLGALGAAPTGSSFTIATVSLPAGVYAINQGLNLNIAAATVVDNLSSSLTVTPVGGSPTNVGTSFDGKGFTYGAVTTNFQERLSTTIVLSQTSLITLSIGFNFTGTITLIAPSSGWNLQSVKLA